ncbi:unnamed protein product [Sympodiomycopsis kandeliae]
MATTDIPTLTCLVAAVPLLLILVHRFQILTLSPHHSTQGPLSYLTTYLIHIYDSIPSCAFKYYHWRTTFSPEKDLPTDQGLIDSVVVMTGIRNDGSGIGFQSLLSVLKYAQVRRVYACCYVPSTTSQEEYFTVLKENVAKHITPEALTRLVPVAMDVTDFTSSYASAQGLKRALQLHHDERIDYFLGTIGVGHDRPGSGSGSGSVDGYTCRYTENDDGIEYQTGVNAVGTMVVILSLLTYLLPSNKVPPPSRTYSSDSDVSETKVTRLDDTKPPKARARTQPARIILTTSMSHFWSTIPPFTIPARYTSWPQLSLDNTLRSNAGRYAFSKLTQLHFITSFSTLLDSAEWYAINPGEVFTPFLSSFLPTWWLESRFGQWNNTFWCYDTAKGSWTGLSALTLPTGTKAQYGYTYLTGLCTVTKPSYTARDEQLSRDCWGLYKDKFVGWFENVGEEEVVRLLQQQDHQRNEMSQSG